MTSTPPVDERTADFSLLVRMDFHLTDADALIGAARELVADEDSPSEIDSVSDAVLTYASVAGYDALIEQAPGVEISMAFAEVAYGLDQVEITPDVASDDEFDADGAARAED